MVAKRPPIVLAHGLVHPLGAATDALLQRSYFVGVPEFLRQRGYRVLDPKVSNMGHVADRAQQLRDRIEAWDERQAEEKVVIIAHSLGGLDARYCLSQLEGDQVIESLVSIGTPHQGCCVADFVVDGLSPVSEVTDVLHKVGLSLKALECLTTEYMQKEFNVNCPDSPDVNYYSISGQKGLDVKEYSPILRPSFKHVLKKEGPNDGMVSVKSSKWGQHLGIYPVDHIEQISTKHSVTVHMYNQIINSLFDAPKVDSANQPAAA